MTTPKSDFLKTLDERGFIHQCTDLAALDDALAAGPGHRLCRLRLHRRQPACRPPGQIMMLRQLQKTGHRPIALMGGGTTKVGDPLPRRRAAPLLDRRADRRQHRRHRGRSSRQFLDFGDGPTDALMVDNADWLDQLSYLPFLRDFGTHFTINRMLTFDCVKLRLEREQPLTLLEFNYMVMQAYDFLELSRRHGCRLQMGGSDQWGNIVNGVELGRRIDGASSSG